MFKKLANALLFRRNRAVGWGNKLIESIGSELAEGFLDILLRLMRLIFLIDDDFQKNIAAFSGKYLFKSKENDIMRTAIFENGKLTVGRKEIPDPNVTVIFKNAKALVDYLMTPKPDILASILKQDVKLKGNFNYLYKFAYMARHLQLKFSGGA